MENLLGKKKGQAGLQGILMLALGASLGILFVVIFMLQVALPTVKTAITAANFTAGTAESTIANLFNLMIVLGVLVAIVGLGIFSYLAFMGGRR